MYDDRESWKQVEQSALKSLMVTMVLLAFVTTLPGIAMWQLIAISELQGGFIYIFIFSEFLSLTPLIFGTIGLIRKKSLGVGLAAANFTGFALLLLCWAIYLL